MKKKTLYIFTFFTLVFVTIVVFGSKNKPSYFLSKSKSFVTTLPIDSPFVGDTLLYPIPQNNNTPNGQGSNHPLYLHNPNNFSNNIEYDPISNQYIFQNKIGNLSNGTPYVMSLEEYMKYDLQKSIDDYWDSRSKSSSSNANSSIIPKIPIGNIGKTLFGSNTIDIRPQGSAELIFGVVSAKREDPMLNVKQQRVTNFDFQEKIQMNVRAKVGDKIDFGINYNTESSFEFDNKMKLAYQGDEDEILQLIEAGDVSFPLTGTLITGSQTLFGIKTKLKFGKVSVTSVFSQQKSESKNITVSGGAQTAEFNVKADDYEENKHFFLSQYFREHYNEALKTLPAVSSSVNISKIEVWVTTVGAPVEQNRNIVAIMDLGEEFPYRSDVIASNQFIQYPDNKSNDLKNTLSQNINSVRDINAVSNFLTGGGLAFVSGRDYEKVESARKLNASEYTLNSRLGFISLNTRLSSDQVLAVAYQFTVVGQDSVFKVGEFSDEGIIVPNNLIVKLLKSTSLNTKIPLWNLMMKNVYSIGAYQINPQDFRLNIVYQNPEYGVPTGFITEGDISGQPLIRALGLDHLNLQLDPYSDGVFDFIDGATTNGGTIQASNGRIFFPVVEPFGKDLRIAIDSAHPESPLAYKYSYDSLYTQTKQQARQYPDKNRFALEGRYKSTGGSEISLNAMQVPQGSVKVTAGGVPLRENADYTVDYTLGRVKIINEGILNSGTPINISLESNSFAMQSKTMLGTHIDYDVAKDFRLGATIMNLTERPLTQKVNAGDEPISNTIWGIDGNYQNQSQWITKMVDKIPFIQTKTPSKISITGEFAQFIPGHPRALGKTGISYIDDFEGSTVNTDLKQVFQWFLASVPRGQTNFGMFPEMASMNETVDVGFNRARLSWFYIDQMFTRNESRTPDYIKNNKDFQSNHFSREIYQKEVFPNKDEANNIPTSLSVLNLSYYPTIRGPYNYDANPTAFSKGVDQNGFLNDPKTRWAGIMRQFDYTDWQSLNYEYIEFWIMDPFIDPDGTGAQTAMQNGGDLYFNIGDISEDILKDGRKSFENGLPTSSAMTGVDSTVWGYVPKNQALTPFFDNNPTSRPFQDVGYDGLSNPNERSFHSTYIDKIIQLYGTGSLAYSKAYGDPSSDDFHHFEGDDYDNAQMPIAERYKLYNGIEGNSPVNSDANNSQTYYQSPNAEDINKDYTLSEEERYYQYRVQIRPDKMEVGQNYISDIYTAHVTLPNKTTSDVKWYLFRIPIANPELTVGQINDFNSIRFMRIFLKNFEEEAHLRFATLDLVKNEWRKYSNELLEPGEFIPDDGGNETSFEVSRVNIEENGKRIPVPYVLPPGIDREVNYASNNLAKLNEQSLVMKVCNLLDGDARAAYKTSDFDFRRYKKIKLYAHAEQSFSDKPIDNGDLKLFIRLGTDFTDNFYEYEMPLTFTPWGTSNDDIIWPSANTLELELDKLLNAKQDRNAAIRGSKNGEVTMYTPYSIADGKNKITVKGTPTLSSVKTIMIGIRNPKKGNSTSDDGLEKCAEVWINELRVTDFDENTGEAANLVVASDLADFGNIVLAGNFSSNGFGSIEKKISERQQERTLGYDVATNLELGKFFKEETGLRIPMHFDYSETFKRPEFNPLNPDIKYKDDLSSYETAEQKDSIRKITEDYTRRSSFNLMNVKKMRTGASTKAHLYDVENFDFSYSYSTIYHRDIDIEYDNKKQYKGAIGYNFTTIPKNIRPLDKIGFLKKYPSLALIRDFNFFYLPKQIGFRSDIDRLYNESLVRKKTQSIILIEPTYVKTFSWNRDYDLRYDFSNSLKFDYTATVQARVDEPAGIVDRNDQSWDYVRDSIMRSVKDFGRITNYNQNFNINYAVPINKIPILNWINLNASYGGNYFWTAAPLSTLFLGNNIENSNKIQLNGTMNFVSLYNKVKYLKKLNQEANQSAAQTGIRLRIPPSEEMKKDSTKTKKSVAQIILDNTLLLMMSVKNANLSVVDGNGSLLPGFGLSPDIVGMNLSNEAPGWDYVFGSQVNIAERAAENDWLTKSEKLNTAFIRKTSNNINGRISIEPIKTFKIDISFLRTINGINQEYWRYDDSTNTYKSYSPTRTGSFSMSYSTIKTSFIKDDPKTNTNATFEQLRTNLRIVAFRLAKNNNNWIRGGKILVQDTISLEKYPDGYSPTNKDVMMYAFLAAYSGQSASSVPLTPFPSIPKPNWRITYNGLTNIPFVARYFKTVSISNSYTSTYNVGSFTSNILYREDGDGMAYVREALGDNYLPKYDFNTITISESFSPLINIDMTMANSMAIKFAIRTTRSLSLSFANFQLTEMKSSEFIVGSGYRFKDVALKINVGGSQKSFKSDINLKVDVSVRSNKTVLRRIIENVDQVSAGMKVITINVSGDYQLSQRIKFKLFYDHVINNPFVNSQYPNSNINAGISLVFSLAG